ncbi:hypothetical protein [Cupriavidus sp. AU9028]|uniref:hypothetical protein n=1 Tax=Cupriavidus sp. AU9028 TaxID=2871157 RepID=UPI001C958031|nr:hypothetical protein [Cupriavidus sp. AU9028]MBY4896485.1 hypothetical protein [Cupriavidus sp. AU9028]
MLVSLWVTRVARSGIAKNGAMLHGTGDGALLPLQARLFVMRFLLATDAAMPDGGDRCWRPLLSTAGRAGW